MSLDLARARLAEVAHRAARRRTLLFGLSAISWSLPPLALASALGGGRWVVAVAVVVAVVVALAWWRMRSVWAARDHAVAAARHIDRVLPEAQSSAELLLRDDDALTLLERMQRTRAAEALADGPARIGLPRAPLERALRGARLALVTTAAAWFLPGLVPTSAGGMRDAVPRDVRAGLEEQDSAVLDGLRVVVTPPAYTGVPEDTLDQLNVRAPEGSTIVVDLDVAARVTGARLVSASEPTLTFEAIDGRLTLRHTLAGQRLVQLVLDAEGTEVHRSGWARWTAVPDQPPLLEVVLPRQRISTVTPGTALPVVFEARDDYRLGRASLVVTLATGSGEMVQFRERRLSFARTEAQPDGSTRLTRTLDLASLGMTPGAELYAFAEAIDNHPTPQRGRSAAVILRMPGDSAGTTGLSEGLPIVLPPETFRSQRQIIIDTEALIAEQGRLSDEMLAFRAESIGFDQAALRLRYGALLGQEFVDGRAATEPVPTSGPARDDDHDHAHGHGEETHEVAEPDADHDHDHDGETSGFPSDDTGPAPTRAADLVAALPGDFMHAHDSEEQATFFDTDTLRTLKGALAAMWEAELHLRTHDPESALPAEYRALRLLKEVQQAMRVYVAKVGFETPPLDPEGKRLTGELDDIRSPRLRADLEPATDPLTPVRGLLARLVSTHGALDGDQARPLPPAVVEELDAVTRSVARLLREGADVDLALLDTLGRLTSVARAGTPPEATDVETVVAQLWRLLPAPAADPSVRSAVADPLFLRYRQRLGPAESGS